MRAAAHQLARIASLELAEFGVRVEAVPDDTKEGVFAIRLTAPLDGKHSGKMVSAEGKEGVQSFLHKRAPAWQSQGQT